MTRTSNEIEAELDAFEAQWNRQSIPPGTPNRKRLQRELEAQSCLPHNVTRRLKLIGELQTARRKEKSRDAAIRRKNDPKEQVRQYVFRRLRKMGFRRDIKTHTGSVYYQLGPLSVRISDHEVPWTPERERAVLNGGFSWVVGHSLVITDGTTMMDAARWLVEVRRSVSR